MKWSIDGSVQTSESTVQHDSVAWAWCEKLVFTHFQILTQQISFSQYLAQLLQSCVNIGMDHMFDQMMHLTGTISIRACSFTRYTNQCRKYNCYLRWIINKLNVLVCCWFVKDKLHFRSNGQKSVLAKKENIWWFGYRYILGIRSQLFNLKSMCRMHLSLLRLAMIISNNSWLLNGMIVHEFSNWPRLSERKTDMGQEREKK